MSAVRICAWLSLLVAVIGMGPVREARGEAPAPAEALVLRLVQPDRQAADVLRLFEGARAPHPAAALAAWKRATKDPTQLGKPLEAVIASFNPEMVPEWRLMHEAELRLDLNAADGKPRWFVVVPRDDGTLAAAITAMRLTDGADEPPFNEEGKELAIERLGPPGAMVAAQVGRRLILGSSRERVLRGIHLVEGAYAPAATGVAPHSSRRGSAVSFPGDRLDSGLVFNVAPSFMTAGAGPIPYRRAVALLNGLDCRRINGTLALMGDVLRMEVTTLRSGGKEPGHAAAACVQPEWLEWMPTQGVMAVVSLAFERGAAFWDWAFALADQIDRADPARALLAPLRTRFNVMAAAAGARPEVDLWPHLQGITAGVFGDPDHPGGPTGALVILHADKDASAHRLATEVLPRLGALLTGKKPAIGNGNEAGPAPPVAREPAGVAYRLGMVGGRSLLVMRCGRDVLVAWGDEVLSASREAAQKPERSASAYCAGWVRAGKRPPQRVGAVWPARCWPSWHGLYPKSPAWRVLADGPPAVWWGWNEFNRAQDSISYADLRQRVHSFLDELPLEPSLLP